jgi:hypothetical protein
MVGKGKCLQKYLQQLKDVIYQHYANTPVILAPPYICPA